MERQQCEKILQELYAHAEQKAAHTAFPLDIILDCAREQQQQRVQIAGGATSPLVVDLLVLLDVTSVSASRAIRSLAARADDASGIRDALVDLWGRAEAARCLLIDAQTVFSQEQASQRMNDLWETARLLAPEAIAIAMRLSEPVIQYVEFASKVAGHGAAKAA